VTDHSGLEQCFISECVASLPSCSLRCDSASAHLVLFLFELPFSNMCHLSVFVENEIVCERVKASILP